MKKASEPVESESPKALGSVRGRPRLFDREAALTQAMRLFWRKGFSATSLVDLTTAMGISPPSLYAAFGSKEALYAEALDHYVRCHGSKPWIAFDNAPTPRGAMRAYLMGSVAALSGSDTPPGCMLALSAVAEEGNVVLGETVRQARARALQRLDDRFVRAVSEGELSEDKARGLGRFIMAVQGGMSLQARDGASREDLEDIVRHALSIWDVGEGES
jgi:AcrR family transcriptional regulator